jgi:hypothetical protein
MPYLRTTPPSTRRVTVDEKILSLKHPILTSIPNLRFRADIFSPTALTAPNPSGT